MHSLPSLCPDRCTPCRFFLLSRTVAIMLLIARRSLRLSQSISLSSFIEPHFFRTLNVLCFHRIADIKNRAGHRAISTTLGG